ncbi:MAG TPA: colanic acid biosynthesis glycosyltransferase WcaL [Alphaproteobacteria bacterium]|nr:colanic acid biosynthesis glycosyltransferase WcaL [Alphaproteobacteria bacterium]
MDAEWAIILKGYPRLSETFIAEELAALERAGLRYQIWSLRHPTDPAVHPVHREIRAPVFYLPEYLHDAPWRVLRGLGAAVRRPGFPRALRQWGRDFRRDPTRNRIRRFGQALVLARELPPCITGLHAHFLHTPASVARYAALLRGASWSFSAHAKDIWTSPEWELGEKLADCAWGVSCTGTGTDYLNGIAARFGRAAPVLRLYHGLPLARFPAPPPDVATGPARDGRDRAQPVRLVSVGRLVDKKGYDILLRALALLPHDCHWQLTHIGAGPLAGQLRDQAGELGLADRIDWRGACDQAGVLAALRASDLFVLACRVSADGDRDGIPNVLMEAQSQKLACVATRISAIPELIREGETGILVAPEDAAALAQAMGQLIASPDRRAAMGDAARARIEMDFAMHACIAPLLPRFGLAPPQPVGEKTVKYAAGPRGSGAVAD